LYRGLVKELLTSLQIQCLVVWEVLVIVTVVILVLVVVVVVGVLVLVVVVVGVIVVSVVVSVRVGRYRSKDFHFDQPSRTPDTFVVQLVQFNINHFVEKLQL